MEILGLLVRTLPVDCANNPVLKVLVTLMTEILGLLVRTAPADDADNTILEVLFVGKFSIQTLYRFLFNPFSIKSLLCF